MSELSDKLLESGIIDKHTAELFENMGLLEIGESEKANDEALRSMTRTQMQKLADEIEELVEKDKKKRETMLDLDHLRWHVEIEAIRGRPTGDPELADGATRFIAGGINAVIDRMGRYYFRIQDVKRDWFVPGYYLERKVTERDSGKKILRRREMILEASVLSVGDQSAAVQVSTEFVETF